MTEKEYWDILNKGHAESIMKWWEGYPGAVGCIVMSEEIAPGRVTTKMAPLENQEDIEFAAKTIRLKPNVLLRTLCFRPWLLQEDMRLEPRKGRKPRPPKDTVTFIEDGEPHATLSFGTIQVDGNHLDYDTRTEANVEEEKGLMTFFPRQILLAYCGHMLDGLVSTGAVQVMTVDEAVKKFGKEKLEQILGGKIEDVGGKPVKEAAEAPSLTIVPGIRVEPVPMPKVAEKDRII